MEYLAVLGRQREISLTELEKQFRNVRRIHDELALFASDTQPEIARLGGQLKIATKISLPPLQYLNNLPWGKVTLAVSDYSHNASRESAWREAMYLKKHLVKQDRSVRMVDGQKYALSTATSLHNGLSGRNLRKCEFIKVNKDWYRVIGVQDIDAYARRDQARPYRDPKVGMLPPKLAQLLINYCGILPRKARVLDPFCGTGVLLQEAALMGYQAYGTDIEPRMIEYSRKNLAHYRLEHFIIEQGDATSCTWHGRIDAVASEAFLGTPLKDPPTDIKLKEQKQLCTGIILGALKNLSSQLAADTPVTIAIPAWLRPDGSYYRLDILDLIEDLGYNVDNKSREGLLYHREGQIVARDIIILRKK